MPLYSEESEVSHPNLFAFVGHLQRTTVDSQADVSHLEVSTRAEAQVSTTHRASPSQISCKSVKQFFKMAVVHLEFLKVAQ